jgi:hypothetical protein
VLSVDRTKLLVYYEVDLPQAGQKATPVASLAPQFRQKLGADSVLVASGFGVEDACCAVAAAMVWLFGARKPHPMINNPRMITATPTSA